jgi:beta-lactamase regulating signal transducer with metallopeptidase domain
MSEVFLKVVNMGISAGWLVLAVLALRFLLKKAPKWVNILLWGIVALRLICPFSIESTLSLIPSKETISPEIMMDWTPEISTGMESLDQVVNPVISTSFAPEPYASANPLQILIPVAANFWLLGVLVMLIYIALS